MIEIDKIFQNNMYQQYMAEARKNSKIDIETNCKLICKKAVEIANKLHINSEIIERAVLFTYLGLGTQTDDYIKVSGALAVRILTQLNEDEDTVARVLMTIAGQGNNGNSINIFSAVILLANFVDLKSYLIINKSPEELADAIKVESFNINYDKKEINYKIEVYKRTETYEILEHINKIIENCANILNLSIGENKIEYTD